MLTLQAPTPQNGKTYSNILSVFGHFVGLSLKGLMQTLFIIMSHILCILEHFQSSSILEIPDRCNIRPKLKDCVSAPFPATIYFFLHNVKYAHLFFSRVKVAPRIEEINNFHEVNNYFV